MRRGRRRAADGIGAAAAVLALALLVESAQARSVEELKLLSIEELGNVEITSVFKRPEPISRTPAAVYVISSEDIRRSGAVSLPQILRLAPNLHVARVDAASYAISARGFNSFSASNKLLVLIDGRSVYTPLHGGVFWDQQQVMPEDIERIEVISGPGGTLWGANAVNGVINIITKNARQTKGALVSLQAGTDGSAAARYGGAIGESGAWRAYAMGFARGESATASGSGADDEWGGKQGGFRADWSAGENGFTFQGDIFENAFDGDTDITGGNLLARWKRGLGGAGALEVQAYYDTVDRSSPGLADELETFDIMAQHSMGAGERHQIVWGAGYRMTEDRFVNRLNPFVLDPTSDTIHIGNLFIQDTIALLDSLTLTIGTKVEYSSYSGLEYLPSARVAWQASESDMIWAAVSRAVRTPSRIDRDLVATGAFDRAGSGFGSEELIAYEVGYRGQPTPETSLSVSLYYNDYDKLRILSVSDSGRLTFSNDMSGSVYGVEAWGDYDVGDWWRLSAGVNLLDKKLHRSGRAIAGALDQHAGNDPAYQLSLRSSMNLLDGVELDVGLRAVGDLPDPDVPDYFAVDARIGWHITDGLEAWVAAFNLFDGHHPETGAAGLRREERRSVYAGARWRF